MVLVHAGVYSAMCFLCCGLHCGTGSGCLNVSVPRSSITVYQILLKLFDTTLVCIFLNLMCLECWDTGTAVRITTFSTCSG